MKCSACGRHAIQETVEVWSRDRGWRHITQVRCMNRDIKPRHRCGHVEVVREVEIEARPAPFVDTSADRTAATP